MPGLDGTGPMGSGPMTGGAGGNCNPVFDGNPNIPMGVGRGGFPRGGGRGRTFGGGLGNQWRRYAPISPTGVSVAQTSHINNDKESLSNQINSLMQQLSLMQERLSRLEQESSDK